MRRTATALAGGLLVLGLSACSSAADTTAFGAHPVTTPVVHLVEPARPTSLPSSGTVAAHRVLEDGVVLPDAGLTPGAVYPDVTTEVLCDPHYVQGVRQPKFDDKVTAFTAYGISIHSRSDYVVDHLVPVGLGGSNDLENLWPEPVAGGAAAQKDQVEARLRELVCSGALALPTAQQAIAHDWQQAGRTYGLAPVSASPEPTAAPLDPDAVVNGGTCPTEGQVALTSDKGVRLTCTLLRDGTLQWGKRH